MKNLIAITAFLALMAPLTFVHAAEEPTHKNLTDGQVYEIVKTRNDGEIMISKYVLATTTNPEVKKLAKYIIEQHTAMNLKKKEIIMAKSIQPQASWKSALLAEQIKEAHKKILALKGKELDMAYVMGRIDTNEFMIEGIKQNLIPIAKDPTLKKQLEATVRANELHLTEARVVRWTL